MRVEEDWPASGLSSTPLTHNFCEIVQPGATGRCTGELYMCLGTGGHGGPPSSSSGPRRATGCWMTRFGQPSGASQRGHDFDYSRQRAGRTGQPSHEPHGAVEHLGPTIRPDSGRSGQCCIFARCTPRQQTCAPNVQRCRPATFLDGRPKMVDGTRSRRPHQAGGAVRQSHSTCSRSRRTSRRDSREGELPRALPQSRAP